VSAPRTETRGQVRRSLLRLLEENVLCAVSTVGPGGRAHVHICYFAFSRALELFFLSDPRSRHATNLRFGGSAAVAVFSSTQTWGGRDRGAQLFGRCARVPPAGRTRARRIYQQRFPAFATHPAARELALYRFRTRQVSVLDEQEFGEAALVELTVDRSPPGRRG